jgi:hypothetical protein
VTNCFASKYVGMVWFLHYCVVFKFWLADYFGFSAAFGYFA